MSGRPSVGSALLVCWACAVVAVGAAEKIKTRAQADKTFDFTTVRTWNWDGADAGDVLTARTASDDPAPIKLRVDPLIRRYVGAELARRPLAQALGSETPDIRLRYYVLVTLGTSEQVAGQFLPAVPYWGLPPFPPATTALTVVTRGSLVLDAMAADRRVVWRGIAQTVVNDNDSDAARDARIKDAARELVKRFPRHRK